MTKWVHGKLAKSQLERSVEHFGETSLALYTSFIVVFLYTFGSMVGRELILSDRLGLV